MGYNAHSVGSDLYNLYNSLIGPGLDVKAAMFNQMAGCYLRVPFTLEDADLVFSLQLHMKYDDGFVAYINGTEVARSNVPSAQSPTWSTRASTNRNNSAAGTFELHSITLTPGLLVDGINMLAIHGMNRRIHTQDKEFVLVPKLTGTTSSIPPFVQSASVIADPWVRGPNDDPDGDGQTNLEEHAAGTDPNVADKPVVLDVLDGTEELNVDVCLRLPATIPADVQYELQHRGSLLDPWATVATKAGEGAWTGIQPGAPGSGRPRPRPAHF